MILWAALLLGCERESGALRGPPTQIAIPEAGSELTYPDLVFTPDGTLWISWVEIHPDETAEIWVVRSDDGGQTFTSKSRANKTDRLFLGGVRQPVLAADDRRVAIAVGGGSYIDSTILLLTSDAEGGPGIWREQVLDEAHYNDGSPDDPGALTLVDQPEIAFDIDGQLMLNWKQGSFEESFQLVLARESDAFAVGRLEDGTRGQPCECCPTDWLLLPSGERLLAFRNNDKNLREVFLTRSPDGAQYGENTSQVSDTAWEIGGCPLDGPSLALAGEVLVATWADASLGDNYQWWAISHDDGRTFSSSSLVYPENTDSLTWPSVASAEDGSVWTSVVRILGGTLLSSTSDLGATFERHSADSPSGPLFYSEIAASPAGIGLVGVTEGGELWYLAYGS